MLRLIQFLIYGHIHNWFIESKGDLSNGEGSKGSRYIMQCNKCGCIKKIDNI